MSGMWIWATYVSGELADLCPIPASYVSDLTHGEHKSLGVV